MLIEDPLKVATGLVGSRARFTAMISIHVSAAVLLTVSAFAGVHLPGLGVFIALYPTLYLALIRRLVTTAKSQ